ncbi:MAG TPA: hypothetical protein VND92_01640 [Vicinamibacterales bacterium]|nr:hypothetical protein [Vicinamibacterales bacterium]
MSLTPLEKRLRWSGVLITAGLVVQLITLWGLHPLAFVAFIVIACPLLVAGMLLFLYTILKGNGQVGAGPSAPPRQSPGSSA